MEINDYQANVQATQMERELRFRRAERIGLTTLRAPRRQRSWKALAVQAFGFKEPDLGPGRGSQGRLRIPSEEV